MKRDEALIEVFGNDEVVESQLFGDFVFEGRLYFFLEESIVSFEYFEEVIMGKIRYNGGFFIGDGSGSVGGGRMNIACFLLCLSFCLLMSGKALIFSTS